MYAGEVKWQEGKAVCVEMLMKPLVLTAKTRNDLNAPSCEFPNDNPPARGYIRHPLQLRKTKEWDNLRKEEGKRGDRKPSSLKTSNVVNKEETVCVGMVVLEPFFPFLRTASVLAHYLIIRRNSEQCFKWSCGKYFVISLTILKWTQPT